MFFYQLQIQRAVLDGCVPRSGPRSSTCDRFGWLRGAGDGVEIAYVELSGYVTYNS